MWTPRTVLAVAGTVAALAGLALAWHTTSLSDYADIGYVSLGHLEVFAVGLGAAVRGDAFSCWAGWWYSRWSC